jgi:hypothetical protein
MASPHREQKRQSRNNPREPLPYEGPENAKQAQRQKMPSRASRTQTKAGRTRGRDQIAHEMATGRAPTRGRDQTAREMAGQRRSK